MSIFVPCHCHAAITLKLHHLPFHTTFHVPLCHCHCPLSYGLSVIAFPFFLTLSPLLHPLSHHHCLSLSPFFVAAITCTLSLPLLLFCLCYWYIVFFSLTACTNIFVSSPPVSPIGTDGGHYMWTFHGITVTQALQLQLSECLVPATGALT
jgi:hypothetical protein